MVEIISSKVRYEGWYGDLPEIAAAQSLSELGLFARQLGAELYGFTGEASQQMRTLFVGLPHGVLEVWGQLLETQAAGALRQKFGKPKEELVGAQFVAAELTDRAEGAAGKLTELRSDLLAKYEQFQQILMQQLAVKLAELAAVQERIQANKTALHTTEEPRHILAKVEYKAAKDTGTEVVSRDQVHLLQIQKEITVLQEALGSFFAPLGVVLQEVRQMMTVAPLDANKAVPV
ncbi:MAG: hypothetical protein COU68_03390 [Candidatus Pacebacteria bacterium CG10_big_fil_rev_8_21_14_0_10_45_6]|nr:MAG: hypothetical protein COU68_03390 [Candidatus Pacebacteria bacterium CG10_big_fil_rev_8_21_14_0_10_45_6]